MDTSSVFRFATLRNSSDAVTTLADLIVSPASPLVTDLTAINSVDSVPAVKLGLLNAKLQAFIDSTAFLKTKAAFVASQTLSGTEAYYNQLFDNVVTRTITKSTTNQVYKLVVDQLKTEHVLSKIALFPNMAKSKVKIVLPDGLIFNFVGSNPSTVGNPVVITDPVALIANYTQYARLSELIAEAKADNVLEFHADGHVTVLDAQYAAINDMFGTSSITIDQATLRLQQQTEILDGLERSQEGVLAAYAQVSRLRQLLDEAKLQQVSILTRTQRIESKEYGSVAAALDVASITLTAASKIVSKQVQTLSKEVMQLVPKTAYARFGDQWVDVSKFSDKAASKPLVTDSGIMVYTNGCWLKFPFQIADLRIVEQQTVGYLPGEIAHINNTQPGELNTRVTRRLKRTEDFESILSEDEVMHETDSQSTEKFGFEKEASQVQAEESSWNVNASASATYGPVSATLDAGYESSNSSTNSNTASQSYAKEVVQKVVDRVTHKVKRERSTKTIEEFEETVTHVIDNTTPGEGPKSYVYRWLNKLTRATLKNYGKRLIFQIDIAHPSHYHVSRTIQSQPMLILPDDPRGNNPSGYAIKSPSDITRENYLAVGDVYRVKLEAPPVEKIIVSKGFANDGNAKKTEDITIPKGYAAVQGKWNGECWDNNFVMLIASSSIGVHYWHGGGGLLCWINGGNGAHQFTFSNYNGTYITDNVAITFFAGPYTVNFEIECHLTTDAYKAWQVKTFQAIVDAYDNLKAEAEAKMSEFIPTLPSLNPQQKLALIRTELKKEALRKLFRCNPMGISDKYVVGQEYQSDCCTDSHNAEKVRFLETVFDWKNLTYEFFPYFYGSRDVVDATGAKVSDNWNEIQKLTDSDPHFEAFLQASYATIRIPVHRDSDKELAAINFVLNNSIANYEVIPAGAQPLLEELELEPITMFTYDLEGNELPLPKESVDLGIFNLPTSLVILECGVQNGIKPIGFPQSTDAPTSDVIIPKQYSPAIIADTCNP